MFNGGFAAGIPRERFSPLAACRPWMEIVGELTLSTRCGLS
jgi:hypothetical protein